MNPFLTRTWMLLAAAIPLLFVPVGVSAHKGHEEARQRAADEAGSSKSDPRPPSAAEGIDSVIGSHDDRAHPDPARTHAAGDGPEEPASNVPKPLAWIGRFHPPLTHFPIALLSVAALAELLYIRTRSSYFENVVHFSVLIGAISALGAATLGWLFGGFHVVDDEWPMTAHRWVGTTTALLSAGLLVLLERARRDDAARSRFRILLFTAAAVVGITGFLGGALVYGLDHYAWSFES